MEKTFIEILDKLAPLKKKYVGATHSKFVTKEFSRSIMLRTKFKKS